MTNVRLAAVRLAIDVIAPPGGGCDYGTECESCPDGAVVCWLECAEPDCEALAR